MRVGTRNKKIFHAALVTDFLLRMEWGISTTMLPIYVHELGGSPLEVGLVFSVFAGIMVFSELFWGVVSDYFGRRKIFISFGMAVLAPIFLLMSLQKEVLPLILSRGSTAIFKGAVVPTTWALVSDISPPEEVGSNMGVLSSIELAGFAFGPAIGGIVADVFGFPALWVFVAVECLFGALVFLLWGSDPPNIKRDSGKFPLETFRKQGWVSKTSVLYVSFSVFLLGFALLGPNLKVYLFDDLGYSRTMVGMLSLVGEGAAMLVQPIIGAYSDKHGRKLFLIIGALNLALGDAVLFSAGDLPLVLVSQILISNYNIFQFIGSAYIADVVPQTDKSAALGLFGSVGSLSRSLGAVIGGCIIAATSTRTLILISAVFPALSIAIILSLLKEPKRTSSIQ